MKRPRRITADSLLEQTRPLVERFTRRLAEAQARHMNEALSRVMGDAVTRFESLLGLRRDLEQAGARPTKAKKKTAKAKATPSKATPTPPPVAAPAPSTTQKGKPRERRAMRCSKCGAEGFRADGCGRTHNVQSAAPTTAVDDDAEDEPRAPRRRSSRAVEPMEERVIPHAALVAMLAADRAQNDGGDAGGFIGGRSCEPSLIGHTDEKRELCPVHGWVGRVAFEHEHFACLPDGEPCAKCGGKPPRTGSLVCKRCNGTGLEPVETVGPDVESADADEPQPTPSQLAKERRGTRETVGLGARSVSIAPKRLTRAVLAAGAEGLEAELAELDALRPKTRADCVDGPRPCPWVSCRHHLAIDVSPETGSLKLNFPDREPWDLEHTCALDVAERGGVTLEEVGEIMNLTRDRIRQVEVRGLLKLKVADGLKGAA